MAASRWNPSYPDVGGDEWLASRALAFPIGRTVAAGATVTATATATVAQILAPMRTSGGTVDYCAVDVYDLANPIADTIARVLCRPGANADESPGWLPYVAAIPSASSSSDYTYVRDIVAAQDGIGTVDDLSMRHTGTVAAGSAPNHITFQGDNATFYNAETGTAGNTITSKRVSKVEVVAIVQNFSGHSVVLDGLVNVGDGTRHQSLSGPLTIPSDGQLTRVAFAYDWNPANLLRWTQADSAALTDGTGSFGVGILVKSGTNVFVVRNISLRISVTTERRIATGYQTGPASGASETYANFPSLSPVDHSSASWTKTSGHRYLLLFSVPRGVQSLVMMGADTALTAGHESDVLSGTTAVSVPLAPGGVPTNGTLTETTGAPCYLLIDTSSAALADSNVYAHAQNTRCSVGTPQQQRISNVAATTYGNARLLVGTDGNGSGGTLQTVPLVVTLRRASDNAVLGGPVNIAPSDVRPDGKFHVVDVHFSPATLTLAEPTLLQVTCAETDATHGWRLVGLLTYPPTLPATNAFAVLAADVGIGGAADDASGIVTVDFPWAISLAPPNPSGLTATAATVANRPVLAHQPSAGNSPTTIAYAHLAWTQTAIGSGFGYNEVQRSYGGTFSTIAKVTLEASHYFNDREGQHGNPDDAHVRAYRMRTVRADGGYSDWVNFPNVAVNVAQCGDIVLASNWSSDAPLAVKDLGAIRSWDQLQTAQGKIQPILGRLPAAFYPPEQSGEQFTRKLAIAYNDTAIGSSVTADRAVFDPILDLLQDRTLPYVSYSDAYGRVWFASPAVQSPGPTREEPNGRYSVTVQFTEIESVPTPITVATPWTP